MNGVNMKYYIFGAHPPPRGGVAMYLSRKVALLKNQGVDVAWVNPRNIFKFICSLLKIRFSLEKNVDRVEIHSAHFVVIFLLFLFGVDCRYFFYDHNYSSSFVKRNWFYIFILKYILPKMGSVVIVSEHLKLNYINLFKSEFIKNFMIETPYIPLSKIDGEDECGDLSYFFEYIKNYKFYFVNSAWKLVDDDHGNDLYGLINSVEVFLKIFENNNEVALVLIIGSDFNGKKEILEKKSKGKDNVLILCGDYNLCSVINYGESILLRTTSTDGDSLSVREAIELNKTVIATDVVMRPEGTYTYPHGNDEELANLMQKIVKE